MKKSYLLLLAIIPLLGSCNKDSGFANPFPNDNYNKIGFKIDDNVEKITRPLTNVETNLVLKTIEDKDTIDKKIYSMSSTKHTREYTRAFAGEFKSGYNVKNLMKKEEINITKQDEGTPSGGSTKLDDYTLRPRTKTENKSTTTSQYSYGQIEEKVNTNDFIYYKKQDKSAAKYSESDDNSELVDVYHRSQKIENDTYKSYDDEVVKTFTPEGEDLRKQQNIEYAKYFNINQSQYITAPDSKSGANSAGEIILVTATQTKHKDTETSEEGVFSLKDGRKYQAMDNNLTVTKLTTSSDKTWYLASYVRIYSETVITSEVIQPNVQVTKLKNPITISYSEEIAKFSEAKSSIPDELPKDPKGE